MVYANDIFFTQNCRFYRFPSEIYITIQLMKERKYPHERILLCHVKNAKMKIIIKCYNPSFFENQSERLAITNPANTCKPKVYNYPSLHDVDLVQRRLNPYCSKV